MLVLCSIVLCPVFSGLLQVNFDNLYCHDDDAIPFIKPLDRVGPGSHRIGLIHSLADKGNLNQDLLDLIFVC